MPVFVQALGPGTVEDRILATGTLRAASTIPLRALPPGPPIPRRPHTRPRLPA